VKRREKGDFAMPLPLLLSQTQSESFPEWSGLLLLQDSHRRSRDCAVPLP
jgi:hypothetical protein